MCTHLLMAFDQINRDYYGAWRLWSGGAWRAWLAKPDIWLKRYQAHAVKVQETHTETTIAMPPPAEAARLAARLRALADTNDPDAQRAGILADRIAGAWEALGGHLPLLFRRRLIRCL
jgi:hypothetical protein